MPETSDNRIIVRFGNELMQGGFTSVPNLVLEHYAALGITEGELLFTIHIWSFWWNRQLPYPSLSTVAARMNKSWRSVHRYAKSLEDKGLLRVTPRYRDNGAQTSSLYDFSPMIEQILNRAGTTPPDRFDRGDSDRFDSAPLSQVTDEVETREEDPDEEPSNEIRLMFTDYVKDFAREFRDQAPLRSSVTRTIRLYQRSGMELEKFIEQMYEARQRTKRYTSNVKSGEGGNRSLMPYFFSVLEDLIQSQG